MGKDKKDMVTMKIVNNVLLLSSGTAVVYLFLHDIAIFHIQLMKVTNSEWKCGTNSNVFLQRRMQKYFNNKKNAYMFPRVFGDEFCDEFGDSLNFVSKLVTYLVMISVNHRIWR